MLKDVSAQTRLVEEAKKHCLHTHVSISNFRKLHSQQKNSLWVNGKIIAPTAERQQRIVSIMMVRVEDSEMCWSYQKKKPQPPQPHTYKHHQHAIKITVPKTTTTQAMSTTAATTTTKMAIDWRHGLMITTEELTCLFVSLCVVSLVPSLYNVYFISLSLSVFVYGWFTYYVDCSAFEMFVNFLFRCISLFGSSCCSCWFFWFVCLFVCLYVSFGRQWIHGSVNEPLVTNQIAHIVVIRSEPRSLHVHWSWIAPNMHITHMEWVNEW